MRRRVSTADNLGGTRRSTVSVGLRTSSANLRVDQAWGSAQIMGAIHDVGGGYYGDHRRRPAPARRRNTHGHPDDKWGWAVGAGLRVNFPMIGPGDYFQAQVNYTEGAIAYAALTPSRCGCAWHLRSGGNSASASADGVYCGTVRLQRHCGVPGRRSSSS